MTDKGSRWAVFIDTSIFVGSNYAFCTGSLASLISICQTGKVDVVLTDITVAETRSNIAESVETAEKTFRQARSKLRVLRNLTTRSYAILFQEFDRLGCESDINKQFDDFIEYAGADVLESTSTSAKQIFADYFAKRPPFGAEKKKSEFPDAFAIAALSDWTARQGRTLHVVSADGDFASACTPTGPMVHLSTLPEFIELVLADEGVLVSVVHDRLKRHEREILRRIEYEVGNIGVILSDQDGEASLEEVVDAEFQDLNIIEADKKRAVLEGELNVVLKVYFDYNDPDSWFRDDDDKSIHYRRKIQATRDVEVSLSARFCLGFSVEEPEEYNIADVVINEDEPMEMYADEDARTFWK